MIIDTPLDAGISIVDSQGRPTMQFQMAVQRFIEQLNAEFGALEAAQAAQAAAETAQTAAETAQTAAEAAQTAAETAQTSAGDVSAAQSLAASGTDGCVITATDMGASVDITISAHDRIYGDGSSVSVAAGTITGLLYTTAYYLSYPDASRAGGTVSYLASTDPLSAAQTGNNHSVGAVFTPAAAAGPTTGVPTLPSGVVTP